MNSFIISLDFYFDFSNISFNEVSFIISLDFYFDFSNIGFNEVSICWLDPLESFGVLIGYCI